MQTYNDPNADLVIDTDEDVIIVAAGSVRVVRCGKLRADGATISGDLWADGAKIGGYLLADGATIGGGLWADGAKIGGYLWADGATIGGGLRADGAKIGGDLRADGAKIGGDLRADGAEIGGDLWADGAKIGGDLRADGAEIGGDLWADGAKIGGDLSAARAEISGKLRAAGAKIGGYLRADGAEIGGIVIGEPTAAEVAIARRVVEDIDAKRLAMDMNTWHGKGWLSSAPAGDYCETTHCLAGAAQCLSADRKIREMDPRDAGRLLLPNLSYLFFAPQDIVERTLRETGAAGLPLEN